MVLVEACAEYDGKTTILRGRLPLLPALGPAPPGCAIPARRGVENRLHRMPDVALHDDPTRPKTGKGPKNMPTIRHVAMNLIRPAPGQDSRTSKGKAAAQDQNHFEAILTSGSKMTIRRAPPAEAGLRLCAIVLSLQGVTGRGRDGQMRAGIIKRGCHDARLLPAGFGL